DTSFECDRLPSPPEPLPEGGEQKCALQPDFIATVLFIDETPLTREGVFNVRNSHVWVTENPRATRPHAYQQQFSTNMWAGIVNDFLINTPLLLTRLNGEGYFIFLEQVLPGLQQVVSITIRNRMMGHQSTSALMCAFT
ncbi:transposable element tc3 transposase, partial [Trichonephila clavipes]